MKLSLKLSLIFGIAVGCSSSGVRHGTRPDYSSQSSAPGWAYATDDFTVDKDQPEREQNSYQFYYKHCEPGGELPFYSKTAYECSSP